MITKERLEQLIEQDSTIYGIDDRWDIVEVRELDSKQLYYSSSNDNFQYMFDDCGVVEFFEDELFETKEDAEEYAEFGNITRTERLELPSWEENLQCAKIIYGTQKNEYNNHCFQYELLVSKNEIGVLQLYPECKDYFWKKKTRENYNEARRLCKKLYLGEGL